MKAMVLSATGLVLLLFFAPGQAAEKMKLGSAVKLFPPYYLPILAADEQGFWKENDLEVEWVPFAGSAAMIRGTAAGAVKAGLAPTVTALQAAGRGLSVAVISELIARADQFVWVRAASPRREPQDLRGARIGVPQLGGAGYAYGVAVARALGLEKDVKFVGVGGISESLASLKAGTVDGIVMGLAIMLKLKMAGEIRELINAANYFPREWVEHVAFARRDLLESDASGVRRLMKAFQRGVEFNEKNRAWAVAKMKEVSGYSEEGSNFIYREGLKFTKGGRVNPAAVKNVYEFLTSYGIITRERTPPVEQLYAMGFSS